MDSQQLQSSYKKLFCSRVSGSTRTRVAGGSPSGEQLDFPADSQLQAQNRHTSTDHQVALMGLNKRLASYMEKVWSLQQQKGALEAELQRLKVQGPTRLDVYQQELKELRHLLDSQAGAKDQLEVQRDNLAAELVTLQRRMQKEAARRQEAETGLSVLRQDVNEASLSRAHLEQRMELLQEEVLFLRRSHDEEVQELQEQLAAQQVQQGKLEMSKPDLTGALKDLRLQYKDLASSKMHKMEEWYRCQFSGLKEAADRSCEALRRVKQETHEYQHQARVLTSDLEALRRANDSLHRQQRVTEEHFLTESSGYQDTLSQLEEEIEGLKVEMVQQLQEHQDLLNIKLALDVEIATYRKLLEEEESIISVPVQSFSKLNLRDSSRDSTSSKVQMQTVETRDSEIIKESMAEDKDLL